MPTPGSSPVETEARLMRDMLRRLAALELANDPTPGGTVRMTIATTAPAGWALMDGQTITDCATLYPDTWAVAPAGWKSGSDLILADMRGKSPLGADGSHTLGSTGGANSRTIATANLPSHTHSGTTSGVSADHSHGFSGTTSGHSNDHAHNGIVGGANFVVSVYAGASAGVGAGGGYALAPTTGGATADHSHTYSGNTGGISANHTHTVTTDGGTGSGTALDTTPAHGALNFIVRLR